MNTCPRCRVGECALCVWIGCACLQCMADDKEDPVEVI